MTSDLDQICDVCGREGNIALRQTVGAFTVALCHLCRYLGATATAAADYRSLEEQRLRKLRRRREFAQLPGPGDYAVTQPWHRITGGQLPRLCCVCLCPADDSFPAPMPPAESPRKVRRNPRAGSEQDPPEADLPSHIPRPSWGYLLVVLGLAAAAGAVLPMLAMWPVMLMVVLFLMHWTAGRDRHHRYTTLPVPICRRCAAGVAPDRPPARVAASAVSRATIVFSNWEYAELVQAGPWPRRATRPPLPAPTSP